jgi:hypothetical protein
MNKICPKKDEWRREFSGNEMPAQNGWYKVLKKTVVIDYDEDGKEIGRHMELANDTWLFRGGWYGSDADFYEGNPKYCKPPEWWTNEKFTPDDGHLTAETMSLTGLHNINEFMLRQWRKEYKSAYKAYKQNWKARDAASNLQRLETELRKGYLNSLLEDADSVIRTVRREVDGW